MVSPPFSGPFRAVIRVFERRLQQGHDWPVALFFESQIGLGVSGAKSARACVRPTLGVILTWAREGSAGETDAAYRTFYSCSVVC